MSHKQADEESTKRAKESIQFFEGMIAKVQQLKSGGHDAVKAGMDTVRELEFDAAFKKDHHLKKATNEDFITAHGFQRMQEAYQNVITLFEAPSDMVQKYKDEINKIQKWLDKFERIEQTDKRQDS